MNDLKQKLQSVQDKTRAARAKQKQVLEAVKHVRALDKHTGKIKEAPGELNVEFAYEGDVLLDFDLSDYPELVEDTLKLCAKLRQLALARVDAAAAG